MDTSSNERFVVGTSLKMTDNDKDSNGYASGNTGYSSGNSGNTGYSSGNSGYSSSSGNSGYSSFSSGNTGGYSGGYTGNSMLENSLLRMDPIGSSGMLFILFMLSTVRSIFKADLMELVTSSIPGNQPFDWTTFV